MLKQESHYTCICSNKGNSREPPSAPRKKRPSDDAVEQYSAPRLGLYNSSVIMNKKVISVAYLLQLLLPDNNFFQALKVKDDKQNSNKEETVIDEFTDDVIPTDDDNEDEEETQLPDESIKIPISGSAFY